MSSYKIIFSLFSFLIFLKYSYGQADLSNSFGQDLEYTKDLDIQETLIAISRKLPRECAVVLIYDEEMPELSMSYVFIKRMQQRGRIFIMLNLSSSKLSSLSKVYGSSNPSDIIQALLHILYRKGRCYTFKVWVKDPRILYPEIEAKHHPGWRQSDYVIVVAHHITKRYRAFINLRIWGHIPNIVALTRNKDETEGIAIHVFTVLPYFRNAKRKPQEIDTWLVKERMFVHNNSLFFDKFSNMHTAPIVLGLVWKEPFFIWGNKDDPYFDGLDWRIFQLCKENLNFTFTLLNPDWAGRKNAKGIWSGNMGMLANGSIDVGVGGIEVTSDGLQDFGFCRTYYTDSYNFIVPLNNRVKTAVNTFFKPLSNEVWMFIFVWGLFGTITLTLVAYLESRLHFAVAYKRTHFPDSHFTSLLNTFGFFITVLCQKPYRHLPRTSAVQFIYYGISLSIFLIGLAFSCCLISVLLSFKPKPLANEVEDILKLRLPISIRNYNGFLNEYMENSGNPMLQKIYRTAKLVDYNESFDAMDDVVKGKMIYIDSTAKIHFSGRYSYTGVKGLKFHISSESVLEFANLGWPVQKNWPLMPKFDAVISRAVESGLVKHWMSKFMQGKFGGDNAWKIPEGFTVAKTVRAQDVDPSDNLDTGFKPLSINHATGLISLYFIGVFLALSTFIIECTAGLLTKIWKLLYRCYKSRRTRFNNDIASEANSNVKSTLKKSSLKTKGISLKAINCDKRKRSDVRPGVSQYPELIWNDLIK